MKSLNRALALLALATTSAIAQDGYRTPPDAIAKILDSPAPPVASVSANRKWLLITTSDVQETTIGELAEPTMFLAGRRFFTQPNSRIDMEGVRSAMLKPVDGGAEITIPVPDGARLTQPQWNRANTKLAYFVMTPQRMTLNIYDVATKSSKAISGQADGRLAGTPGWSRDGNHFAFSATTKTVKRCGSPTLTPAPPSVSRRMPSTTSPVVATGPRGARRSFASRSRQVVALSPSVPKRRPARLCRNRSVAPCPRAPTPIY
jgi:hypothetical protein